MNLAAALRSKFFTGIAMAMVGAIAGDLRDALHVGRVLPW